MRVAAAASACSQSGRGGDGRAMLWLGDTRVVSFLCRLDEEKKTSALQDVASP